MKGSPIIRLIAVLCIAFALGCSSTVGNTSGQTADKITDANGGPTAVDMIDLERGSLKVKGAGPGRHLLLTDESIETQSVGSTNRSLFYDAKTGRLVLDSGSDITAEAVEVRPDGDGRLGLIKIGRFTTSSSEPTRASNEAYDRLAAVWQARDQASKEALLAEIEALKITAPEVASALLTFLGGL